MRLGARDYLLKDRLARLPAAVAQALDEAVMREARRRSEARLTATVENALDAIVTIDPSGQITGWNPSAERLFGWYREEVVGKRLADVIIPWRYRDAHERGLALFRETGEGPVLGKVLDSMTALHRDGREFPVELAISPAWRTGEQVTFVGFLRDISDRRSTEQLKEARFAVTRTLATVPTWDIAASQVMQGLCDSLGWDFGATWMVDADSRALAWHSSWHARRPELSVFEGVARRLTFAPGVGLPGRVWAARRPLTLLHPPEDGDSQLLTAAQAAGLQSAICFPIIRDRQVAGAIELFSPEMRTPDEGLLRTFSDVGSQIGQFLERQEAESRRRDAERALEKTAAELEQRNLELERSNNELEQFAYVASHDLSEPLRMVSSYLQLLERRYREMLDQDAREFIGFAVDGASRMQGLIDDLLAYSRVGRVEQGMREVDMGAVTEEVLRDLGTQIEEKRASVQVGPLPMLWAEPLQQRQLLQNLISNALKFSRPDVPPRIQVSAERNETEWVMSVADNGIGIEPQHRERIFNMFQRLHGRGEYPGTGIGLAICKKIVERHGGRIWVEPAGDGGSVLRFSLRIRSETG
jgi:PAS domain S-box-containing protein